VNIYLPNGNGYGEINLKTDNMALQTAFLHLFNPPPILKPCATKEKSLAALCNVLWQPLDTKSNDNTSGKALS